ncbi:allantoinase AllB [Xanthobacter sp. KR7-65]|uniref:allantoinase AllB n=1 Tax=Xanthobacter sp. KR7-65 TaxID=3156612 RepID=UPI0032B51271
MTERAPDTLPADLVIHGGIIVTGETQFAASIAIRDGRIFAVGDAAAMPAARETFDAAGLHILPGAIDVHVHFRDPGYTHKEDFESGTAAAAFGGVTTVFDMPNTIPTVADAAALTAKHAIAASKAHVDYGLYAVLGEDTIDKVPELVEAGIIGFKLYMGNTFGRIPTPSTGAMLEAFEVVAPTGKRVSLHAETNSVMERRQRQLVEAGRTDALAHLASRPAVVAVEAVARAAILAEWTGARIHVLHISSAAELGPLRDAKARGVDITGETCPHYLMLGAEDYARWGGIIRVNPPVREAANQQPLWDALADGTIDMIATDHAPHTPEEKTRAEIWSVDCGFPGVETQMPLMLTEVAKGRYSLSDYVRWSAVNPARIWGLYPRKGVIQPGADADLAFVDMGRTWTIRDADLKSRSKVSPWDGRDVTGMPVHTMVRGRFVVKDRALQADTKGHGRPVHTFQQMPAAAPRHADQTIAAATAVVAPGAAA